MFLLFTIPHLSAEINPSVLTEGRNLFYFSMCGTQGLHCQFPPQKDELDGDLNASTCLWESISLDFVLSVHSHTLVVADTRTAF